MAQIDINKGHNIRIAGVPRDEIVVLPTPSTVAIKPVEFRAVKPKLLVKIGDQVSIGSPLFYDKVQTSVRWPSPAAGTIKDILFGARRVIERIVIEVAEKEDILQHPAYKTADISTLGREKILQIIIDGNLWPLILQRPFNKVANPLNLPRDIFISGWNTAPLTVNLDLALRGKVVQLQAGLNALQQLTKGSVHLSISENTVSDTLLNVRGVKIHQVSGPHPAGNVGIQIHHTYPLRPHEVVWTIQAQHVVTLGQFFLTGEFDPNLVVTVAGPGVIDPVHVQSRVGANIGDLLKENLQSGSLRIISGDVLTGKATTIDGFLGFFHSSVTVIPEGGPREFMSIIRPGTKHTHYSLKNAFFGFKNPLFHFNTLKNGSERAMIPINAWEDVLPMDILPNALFRAIIAQDLEEMEQLGIYECDEEDFALCSFACPSKIDVGAVIRQGLDLVEKEG